MGVLLVECSGGGLGGDFFGVLWFTDRADLRELGAGRTRHSISLRFRDGAFSYRRRSLQKPRNGARW